MARKQSPHTWLILLVLGTFLLIGGVWILIFPDGETVPQWPFSETALGVTCLGAAVLNLVMAFHVRSKR